MNPRDISSNDYELDELDQRIAIMKAKREEIVKERENLLPNGLDKVMSAEQRKESRKRRVPTIEKDNTYIELQKLLQDQNSSTMEEEKEIEAFLSNEERSRLKKVKKSRRVYDDDVKKLAAELANKYSKKKVADVTNISISNIKRWKSNANKGKTSSKRGKRVKYPDLEKELITWLKEQRLQKTIFL